MKTLTIITGASKGLGFELARQSLKAGDTVVTMERRPSKALVEEADKIGCNFIQFTADLLDRKGAVELLMWLLSDKEYAEHDRLILINNAGVLGPVGPIENASPQAAVDCIRVNFEIPVLLTQAFLNETRDWKGERRVMNISSGAGRKSVPGWAMYCSTKAALDRFTAVTAEDQQGKPNPARLSAVAPGVVNTDMQGRRHCQTTFKLPQQRRVRQRAHLGYSQYFCWRLKWKTRKKPSKKKTFLRLRTISLPNV